MTNLWGVLWRSENKLDGKREYIMNGDRCVPVLFRTKKEANKLIQKRYGHIKDRPDLRKEPHGWKMPIPVKVKVEVDCGEA